MLAFAHTSKFKVEFSVGGTLFKYRHRQFFSNKPGLKMTDFASMSCQYKDQQLSYLKEEF